MTGDGLEDGRPKDRSFRRATVFLFLVLLSPPIGHEWLRRALKTTHKKEKKLNS